MSHAYDYPDRDAVLGCISNVENATAKLRAFADDYLEMRQKSGPEDAMTIEAAKLVLPWVEEIDTSQRELAQHLPNMLAAGDQATYWLDKSLSANDAAATYTRDLKKLGPELFGSGAAFTVDEKVEAPNSHGGALFNIKTMTGKVVPVTANLSDTISTLKSRYQEREGVPPDQQRLIFKGKQLDDDAKTLAECTISAGETLHLVLRVTPSNSGKSAEEREKDSAMVDIEMMSEGDADEVRCPPVYSPPLTVAVS